MRSPFESNPAAAATDKGPLCSLFSILAKRGARRTSVSQLTQPDRGATAERGHITIRNRSAHEAFAADGYGKPEAEYRRVLGPMR